MTSSGTCKMEFEKEAKCDPHKYYEMFKYTLHHLPSVFPEMYKSSELIKGDGESVGSIRLWTYLLPGSADVQSCKEKIHAVDDENMTIVLDIYEGDHKNHYNCFVISVQVTPKADGCLAKWILEYEKCAENTADPHSYMELFSMVHEKVDGHLVNKA